MLASVVVLEESPYTQGSSRTNLQVLVLVLAPQRVLENFQGLCILQTARNV